MLVQCDASQLEWRTLVELAHDKTALAELLEGQDFHALNQVAWNLPSRLIAKIFLFRTIFRGSGWSFANDPDFMHVSTDSRFWDDLNEKFFRKYQDIDLQHKKWAEIVMRGKPIEGPLGRSWAIKMRDDFKIPWTTLSNYPVQGTGADIMMIVRIMAYKRLKALGIPVDFISTVHDSIVVDCRQQYIEAVRKVFHECFADLPKNILNTFGYVWNVPMLCECKFGMNMKDMKKFS